MSSSNQDSKYKCSLGPEALRKAKEELNEDPSTRLIEVKTLRKRLEKIPGLVARTDIQFLLRFLRARKFDQEKAFQLIMSHYECKAKNPDIFADLKPSRVLHVKDVMDVLEHRNKNGCKVAIFRMARWDSDKYPVTAILQLFYLILNSLTEDEETQVYGVHLICSLENISWKQASHITPRVAKIGFGMSQDVIPLRLKRIDYVYEPSFWDTVFTICKPFIKEKLRNRIFMNGQNVENLHSIVSPDHLPTDMRGPISLDNAYRKSWLKTFFASDAHYEEENKFGFVNMELDDDKKVSKSEDAGMAGLGGTFKKLQV